MEKTRLALIVAGGKGERMNADIPKQFLEINGKPVLMHTLEVFSEFNPAIRIVLVLPSYQFDFWTELCKKHAFDVPHQVVAGGKTRFHSVKCGLEVIKTPALVAVHDGVRPLVNLQTISRSFNAAEEFAAAVPVVDLVDSIRQITAEGSVSVDRSGYKLVQTPQVFDGELLKRAYEQEFSSAFTDDASVVEAIGAKICLVEGNRENIKITTAMDLAIAEMVMKSDKFK